jgi:RNA polymerase sigma-70 factor, ECF subfamily
MSATCKVRTAACRVEEDWSSSSDEQLLLQYRDGGDRELFAELVRRHERTLYNYLRRYTGSVEVAEDAFQATFLQVHLKCEQFEEGRRFRPWLYAIAIHQAIDARRRSRRHQAVSLERMGPSDRPHRDGRSLDEAMLSDEPSPADRAGQAEDRELLRAAMDELSAPVRMTLQLVYYEGLKYREAAEIMNVPVGTIKSRVNTAVARLTEIWNRCRPVVD